ncbi:MAG: DNA gyrase subunit A [Clostridiales bacterium]|jgi:DNA gyrase subunit A|nr:DNA gyrase subunit A [Clostridiales bacterium]
MPDETNGGSRGSGDGAGNNEDEQAQQPQPEQAVLRIVPVEIESEMKKSFIEYAMSVIVDRALPDVRDGLKPVHRRILYAMSGLGFTPDKAYRKCATVTGEVMGKYHPHGDLAVYDSLVRMAQNFSLRHMLIDGHGNFGSRDGDPPAAQRYTESRLSKIAMEMLADINKNTVDFKPNYDDHETEPVVLPARFPNLLVNGSSGIAVGMATNIPPHNLGEVIDGVFLIIDHPESTIEDLMRVIKGPDFPTGGQIVGRQGIRDAYRTGRGRIIMRAHTEIESISETHQRIIVHSLPYQVNKAKLIEHVADLVKEKRLEGISDINDESDRTEDVRITIQLKRDTNAGVVLNQLYKNTQLQEAFNVNMLAVTQNEDGRYLPAVINLRQALDYYIRHQKEVVARRVAYDLERAEAHAHILEGLKKAIDVIDEVIAVIRASRSIPESKERLIERFDFSEKQAQAIVELRLGRLSGLERERLEEELAEVQGKIKYYREILADESLLLGIIKDELRQVRDKYEDGRRSEIIDDEGDFDLDDLIAEEKSVITLTHFGYIKRQPVNVYRSQKRGGKGVTGLSTREEDFVETLFTTSTHNILLFFTNRGRVYRLKAYQIPEAGRQAKGTAIVNLLELDGGERVETIIPVDGFRPGDYLMLATKNGFIKKTDIMEYDSIRRGGLTAVTLRDNDELIGVRLTDGSRDVILVTKLGMSIRFNESGVRPLGRVAMGVTGIRLSEGDSVVGMAAYIEDTNLLIVTENGFGKRTELSEYRVQSRAGKGILTYRITERTGPIAGMKLVNETDDAILISSDGTIIRMPVATISVIGRATQGVTLMRTSGGNRVVGLARIIRDDDEATGDADIDDAPEDGDAPEGNGNSAGAESPTDDGNSAGAESPEDTGAAR